MSLSRQPVLAISHGGGPCFSIEMPPPFSPDVWAPLKAHLVETGANLSPRPTAIVVVSGHWEENVATVNSAANHQMLYDYYGFPRQAYELKYPAKGDPGVAAQIRKLLESHGIESGEDPVRGLDHGVFVPFMVMFPEADIPIVQLSLRADLDATFHLALGNALSSLRSQNVLIIGSGNSYHNLRAILPDPRADEAAGFFAEWLDETMVGVEGPIREARLTNWEAAPAARFCHPRAEHFLPYVVAAGAANGDAGTRIFHGRIVGKMTSGYRFG